MHKTKISFLIIAFSAFFLTPVFAENKNTSDSKEVSVELRFVCEKPGPNCSKMINEDNKEELFLENQPQFTINDLGLARVVSTSLTEFEKTQDKRKSLILKGKEEKPKPLAEIILYFTEEAKQKLAKVTSENIHRRLGIVINGKLIMAPSIAEPITGGEIKISGLNITKEYAEDLVSRINAITKIDEQKVQETFMSGLGFLRKGMYDLAIAEFNKVIHVNPNRAEAYGNRGNAYLDKGNFDRAILDFSKVIEINPNLIEAYNNRGAAYSHIGNYDKAISDYSEAIKINPNHAEPYYGRSLVYFSNGKYDKAWEDVHRAESLGYKVPADFLEKLKKISGKEK